jgi:hypothetical protein
LYVYFKLGAAGSVHPWLGTGVPAPPDEPPEEPPEEPSEEPSEDPPAEHEIVGHEYGTAPWVTAILFSEKSQANHILIVEEVAPVRCEPKKF